MKIISNDTIAFIIAILASITITTLFFSVQRAKSVNASLDRCQMICLRADSEVSALKIKNKILQEQVRQLKALIPTNVELKIELSDVIKESYGSAASH